MAEGDAEYGTICNECGELYSCDDGCEPDGLCHPCAHKLAHTLFTMPMAEEMRREERVRIVTKMRTEYPMNQHAREWADWIEKS